MKCIITLFFVLIATNAWAEKPPYEVEVIVNGRPIREYQHEGRRYIEGHVGERYAIRVRNNTNRRVEVVASVDGLDVVDGKKADYVHKRGYVLGPWQTYDIKGFRLSLGEVAAFRFSTVEKSYAWLTGDSRNIGVIGVAFFPEKVTKPTVRMDRGLDSRFLKEQTATRRMPAASADASQALEQGRSGLGTEFGEAVSSQVVETRFIRANPSIPERIVAIYYNDREGLIAMGVPLGRDMDTELRMTAQPFPGSHQRFATPPPGWCDCY